MNRFDEASKTWDKKQTSIDSSNACVENLNKHIKLKDDANILDYGCGTGFISFALSNETNNILGMDYSDGMVERFNEKAKELNFDNIKAMKHNMNEDEIEENKYDLFISSMTMHHIKDTNMFAKKAYDCLVDGGIVCINDLEKEDGTFHAKHNNDGVEHFGYEENSVKKIFEDVGFQIISFETTYIHKRNEKEYPLFNLIAKK
ncbi:S-adenosylmethionine-dependent methyltransferase [Malaciobacter pacificus]|uniref:SAM-dependent methyltransferase n=1 Tax=Malaciobacter pacificus TaxID=1080223 RepID=A0A5C2HCQ0_9BACT|nr:class I SAM-dependent methyltransferase [Malaciobacter pacificus]QEP34614.1 SAM-dependent methyltransferase [Malaciobacter pacificus]GGD37364.1 S-adenosylmethionine-dependent methyltransferase [Malaciobacter pacificus]